MSSMPWLIIGIGELIILLAIIAWLVNWIKNRPVDYYTLSIIGIIWLLFGLVIRTDGLWLPGLIMMIIGLAHRSEWKKNRLRWSDHTKGEKRFKCMIAITMIIMSVVYYVIFERGLNISRELLLK